MFHFLRFLFSKAFLINLIVLLFLVAGGLYFTLYYLSDFTQHGKTIAVPALEGKMLTEIDDSLKTGNFIFEVVDSLFLKEATAGEIVNQIPSARTTVKSGRKIYLTIASLRPPQIEMPKFVDLSLRQATSLMETYGFKIGELKYEPNLCLNCILEQSIDGEKIEEGTKIDRGSTIDLVVGMGLSNELTAVPYLLGAQMQSAEVLLKNSFLNIGSLNFDETVLTLEDSVTAKVYKQTPFYSEKPIIQMGSSIDLYFTLDTNRVVHTVNPSDTL